MINKDLNNHLIDILRKTVEERYQYNKLKKMVTWDIPMSEEWVDELRMFFLQYIYPDATSRIVLNKAFENLDKHFKNPRHLLDLLGNGFSLAFKFGLQFPKAFKASLQTLESFKQAMLFENNLCAEAKTLGMIIPITEDDFEKLISKLPKEQVQDFIKSSEELFLILTDISLLKKSIEIVNLLLIKMKDKPYIYDEADIAGIATGLKILEGGYHLFSGMSAHQKKVIIDVIREVEHQNLERIFQKFK